MKIVYFVRHGESQTNADGLIAGSKTDSPLTDKGRQQAYETAAKLDGKTIGLIVSSPLQRAIGTAEIVAENIGYRDKIVLEPLFTERDFGSVTGLPRAEAHALLDRDAVPDAEPIGDFGKRARGALDWLRSRPEEYILIVSHAAFGRMLDTMLPGGRPEDFLEYHHLSNGEVFEFTLE